MTSLSHNNIFGSRGHDLKSQATCTFITPLFIATKKFDLF